MSDIPVDGITLGQHQPYVDQYDASLLQPIPRSAARESTLTVAPFGWDIWTAYELSWLDAVGLPQVAIAEFTIPARSPAIVESKSFKYYLNSFNQTRISSRAQLAETLEADLSAAVGAKIGVHLHTFEAFLQRRSLTEELGRCIDAEVLISTAEAPAPHLLKMSAKADTFKGMLVSHLFKSNCPVTGQPDWASLWLSWSGPAVDESSLLAYLVSFRQHQDFHEHCVERIYSDLQAFLQPEHLSVYARYTRRGGIDINPFRSSRLEPPPPVWGARQ